jgi:hypothetical protein
VRAAGGRSSLGFSGISGAKEGGSAATLGTGAAAGVSNRSASPPGVTSLPLGRGAKGVETDGTSTRMLVEGQGAAEGLGTRCKCFPGVVCACPLDGLCIAGGSALCRGACGLGA